MLEETTSNTYGYLKKLSTWPRNSNNKISKAATATANGDAAVKAIAETRVVGETEVEVKAEGDEGAGEEEGKVKIVFSTENINRN